MRRAKNPLNGSNEFTRFIKRRYGPAAALIVSIVAALVFGIPKSANRDAVIKPSQSQEQTVNPTQRVTGAKVSGRVVKVSDGDTVTVLLPENKQLKVRLLGIDAPEKSQPFGETCRQNLAGKIAGKDVIVEVAQNDRYGRSLGKIQSEGQDINLGQIKDGCAWHYKQYASNQRPEDRELYSQFEIDARNQRKGLWQDPTPQQPWQYRLEGRQGRHRSSRDQKRGQVSEQ